MNRRALSLTCVLLFGLACHAEDLAAGYYRIKNVATSRYLQVVDNRGEVREQQTTADLGALQTVRGFENVETDLSSVLYISKLSSTEYDIAAQGTSLYKMMSFGIRLQKTQNSQWVAYQERGGIKKLLNDLYDLDNPYAQSATYGVILTNDSRSNKWHMLPISSETDNYLAVNPTIQIGTRHFGVLFCGFPFKCHDSRMKVWYVSKIDSDNGIGVLSQIQGSVPKGTPVLIECVSDSAGENRLDLLAPATSIPAIKDNKLTGVYFCNKTNNQLHRNVVAYDKTKMLVAGANANGKLALVKDKSLDFIPANSWYLSVAAAPDSLLLMTQTEYEEYLLSKVEGISLTGKGELKVYSLDGRRLNVSQDQLEDLPVGMYFVNGKKYLVR